MNLCVFDKGLKSIKERFVLSNLCNQAYLCLNSWLFSPLTGLIQIGSSCFFIQGYMLIDYFVYWFKYSCVNWACLEVFVYLKIFFKDMVIYFQQKRKLGMGQYVFTTLYVQLLESVCSVCAQSYVQQVTN